MVQIHGLPFKGYGAVPEGMRAGLGSTAAFGALLFTLRLAAIGREAAEQAGPD
jgi:hypothetical protein